MPKTVKTVIGKLFTDGKPPEEPREFAWRLVRRRGLPFLLLPTRPFNPRVSLVLYSAQRNRAKIWRAALPFLFRSPVVVIFHRISVPVDLDSRIIRFISEQTGVPANRLTPPAIKFGGLASHKSRLVLLACDQTNRPMKVIKLGLDAAGRAATEREADLLEKLPPNMLGGIRSTGRFSTSKISAFATDYFPGDSPENDLGMEILFHAWINPGPAVAVETLPAWSELETVVASAAPGAWQALRTVLAGKSIRTTLHHGDFTPWNIRAINSQQIQAFDWERGALEGIPGWDWFHFVVQTSILARRHSVERSVAELEELLQSPRFLEYAEAAGMRDIAKPLALAYLLHHRWVVKPLDGGQRVEELFAVLSERWDLPPVAVDAGASQRRPVPAGTPGPNGLWVDARDQMKSAWSQLANVFWEPNLAAVVQPPFWSQLKSNWLLILLCGGWLVGACLVQFFLTVHLLLLPVFAIPCLLAGWQINRRWGTFFAALAALAGPVLGAVKDTIPRPVDVTIWNILMRFIILQMTVYLADRIHREGDFFEELATPIRRKADLRHHWAIFAISILWFFLIAVGDLWTGPRVSFLPLYLFPAMLVTLFLNLRWGTVVVLLGSLVASLDEYYTSYNSNVFKVFAWNFPMRFLVLFLVIALLNRLRHDNVLFNPTKSNGHSLPEEQS